MKAPYPRRELGATIGDNVLRKDIVPEDLLEQCLSNLESSRVVRERGIKGDQMGPRLLRHGKGK